MIERSSWGRWGQELDWRRVTGQLRGVHILLLVKSEVTAAKGSRKHRVLGDDSPNFPYASWFRGLKVFLSVWFCVCVLGNTVCSLGAKLASPQIA